MVACKDCLHVDVCRIFGIDPCPHFRDRSRFVELPSIDDYEDVKLLDIAIDSCYKVAMSSDPDICVEYKAEHMRLCGWLGDLRRRIEAEQALKGCETNAECG